MNSQTTSSRAETVGYYAFLVTAILSPIIFWPSTYIAVDTVKTAVIGLGVLVSSIFLGYASIKEKRIILPPKPIFWTSAFIIVSLIISALLSTHIGKSLFGQGFESNTVSFIAILFVAALAAFTLVQKDLSRSMILYVGIFASYLVVFIFHTLRIIFGPAFASFGVFTSQVSTPLGNWFDLGTLSLVISLVTLCGVIFLPLSKKMKIIYWAITILSAFAAFVVGDPIVWQVSFLALLGLAIFMSIARIRSKGYGWLGGLKHLAWIPVIACVVAGILAWKGNTISKSVVSAFGVQYSSVSLPWQMTLDVTAGVIKQDPLFGIGANHFSQAYLMNKPDAVNLSDGWNIEFAYGFGFIPTLIAEQGLLGLILWILFFVFFGLGGYHAFKNISTDPSNKFIIISSYLSSVFLWIVALISVPSHTILFLTLLMTAIFFGSSAYGRPSGAWLVDPKSLKGQWTLKIILIIVMTISAILGVIYVKKLVALSYFGDGVKQLTVNNDPVKALALFATADKVDHLDVYLQGKTEAELATAGALATAASKATDASSSQALIDQFGQTVNAALLDARAAIAYDPTDYYDRISEARVSELATNMKMQNAYDNAVQAYMQAINLNPKNPSIYLSLAKLEVNQNKLDDAVKAIGASLQVKSNYLDAVFLLSQVYAEKGDLANAIIAAQFASQLNPNNPQVFFQLGLLQYNNKDYTSSVNSFATAIKLQPDYANAQYFLGLSYAQLGNTNDAIAQFTALSKTNPDNQEVMTILKTLSDGKSIFANPQEVAIPAKRPALPIKTPSKISK